jgi:hypothetical protein
MSVLTLHSWPRQTIQRRLGLLSLRFFYFIINEHYPAHTNDNDSHCLLQHLLSATNYTNLPFLEKYVKEQYAYEGGSAC